MNRVEKHVACLNYFMQLAEALSDTYEIVGSCNRDESIYLIPKGTENEISYQGKPELSFRVSDHWNWYANTERCPEEWYIQCYSIDMPYPRQRPKPNKASKPRFGDQVAFFDTDQRYYAVFGEVYDRGAREWSWIEVSIDDILEMLNEKRGRRAS